MGVLNIVTHNSSYKGHKPLVETNLPLPTPCRDRMIIMNYVQKDHVTPSVTFFLILKLIYL
jgi:hypothetical protein